MNRWVRLLSSANRFQSNFRPFFLPVTSSHHHVSSFDQLFLRPVINSFHAIKEHKMSTVQPSSPLPVSDQPLIKPSVLDPPSTVIGMTTLDRNAFTHNVSLPCLKIKGRSKDLNQLMKVLKTLLVKIPQFKPIQHEGVEEDQITLIHLNPDMVDLQTIQEDHPKLVAALADFDHQFICKEITLTYDNYNAHTILGHVLKSTNELVSSFSIIGHLLHLNLKSNLDPFKQLIGQVLLDKNPNIQLVVNKLDKIDSTFRFFEFETLAKRNDQVTSVVQVRESGCTFRFDFARVYWNPRLSTEHDRIVRLLQPGQDVVYDVFAGVGPFAIPAAVKRRCKVIANDLNPASFEALKENVVINKATTNVVAHNLDGREFIEKVIRDDLMTEWKERHGKFELQNVKFHILMNLPALALDFLSSFVGLYDQLYESDVEFRDVFDSASLRLPQVHCYTFYKGTDGNGKQIVHEQATKLLQWTTTMDQSKEADQDLLPVTEIKFVRKVAPNKDMLRLSFELPKSVLVTNGRVHKRQKIE